jgi:hypothetical protein
MGGHHAISRRIEIGASRFRWQSGGISMLNKAESLLASVKSGYDIVGVKGGRSSRRVQLRSRYLPFYAPTVQLTTQDYDRAMVELIDFLSARKVDGDAVDIEMDHYGREWVEWRKGQRQPSVKLALSHSRIRQLKEKLQSS